MREVCFKFATTNLNSKIANVIEQRVLSWEYSDLSTIDGLNYGTVQKVWHA